MSESNNNESNNIITEATSSRERDDLNSNSIFDVGRNRNVDVDSSDFECKIEDGPEDDDYLETLDRKVSEIINSSRNLPGNKGSYGGSGRRRKEKISPGSARRISTASGNNNTIDDVVRFDENDGGGESTDSGESSQEELGRNANRWSDADESDDGNTKFMLRRRR